MVSFGNIMSIISTSSESPAFLGRRDFSGGKGLSWRVDQWHAHMPCMKRLAQSLSRSMPDAAVYVSLLVCIQHCKSRGALPQIMRYASARNRHAPQVVLGVARPIICLGSML